MKRQSTIVVALVLGIALFPALTFADVGDMGSDMDGDMANDDMEVADAADVGKDADPGDMRADTAGDLASSPDEGMRADAEDVSVSTDAQLDMASRFTFSGTVTLTPPGVGTVTVLMRNTESDLRLQTATRDSERFVIDEVPAGTYLVRISANGYETIEDTLEVTSDTARNFELFLAASAVFFADITLVGRSSGGVTVTGTSRRGEFEETVEIEGGVGQFSTELGVATWQITFAADGFETVTQRVDIPLDRESTSLAVKLFEDAQAEVVVDEGCAAARGTSPSGGVLFVVLGLLALLGRRKPRGVRDA